MAGNFDEQIVIAHGGGGELTRKLIADRFLPRLGNALLNPLADSAILDVPAGRLAFTTDAHVIQPLEFPGGDIGRLSVCGTVNDLAVMGAIPRALSLAMVIEEGLSLAVLDRIVDSIAAAAREAGVVIATGDTKVVERQRGDGLTITTAGVGELRDGVTIDARRVAEGDAIIITGRIAEHGLAVMSAREGLTFQTELRSDVAPLTDLIGAMLATGADIKFMRDPTRGGLACVLADLADYAKLSVEIHEPAIPLSAVARHTAELLGLDPLTVPNEGKAVVVTARGDAEKVLRACRDHRLGRNAAIIGSVVQSLPPLVELITRSGGRRLVQRPYGEELPRIC
ncbi:MAG TPA: hydrogenase expression/formation protein HypE [Phycisphaerae bacterium]|nr:hydrogenase expression/formation protein HypE [Phycisphaerae bacterium]